MGYKHVDIDLKGLEAVKKKLFDDAVKIKTKSLIKYAQETLKKAYSESEYTNRTLNLKDSYVWGVFFNGRRIDYGFLTIEPEADVRKRKTGDGGLISGREEAQKFIDSYIPNNIGWEVVFAATIYYGMYLEMSRSGGRQYLVISSIFDDVLSDFGNAKQIQNIYTYMPKGF